MSGIESDFVYIFICFAPHRPKLKKRKLKLVTRFPAELQDIAEEFKDKDQMARLILLELLKGQDIVSREMEFRSYARNSSIEEVIPFSFGNVEWLGISGNNLSQLVYDYQEPIMVQVKGQKEQNHKHNSKRSHEEHRYSQKP